MHEILLNNLFLPQIIETGYYTAASSFFHMNRTADFHVFLFVVEGKICVTEGNVDYEIKSGETLFLKSKKNHFGKFETPKGTRWYYVHFYLDQKLKKNNNRIILPKKCSGLLQSDLENNINKIVEDFQTQNEIKKFKINSDFFQFLCSLYSYSKGDDCEPSLSDKICSYLDSKLKDDFNVKDLENKFCLSYKRLAAIFKSQKNESMKYYHTKMKIKYACKLMRTTILNISEIAEEIGFNDQLYFSKVFKQFTGKSPRDWRKEMKY